MPSRLEKLIHYIVSVTEPEQLGATKLAKVLWFSDLEHFRQTGRTISLSDHYVKRDNGPLHADFYTCIEKLEQAGDIAERRTLTPVGTRREFVWLSLPDMSEFNGQELATLHAVLKQILPLSAKGVSDLSHVEPWNSAMIGERLPIAAAAVQFGEVDDDDLAWAESAYDAVCSTS